MSSRNLFVTTTMIVLWLQAAALAQEKTSEDEKAKIVGEKFAKALLVEKNLKEAAKLTAVPFLDILQGREEKPRRLENAEDVKTLMTVVVKDHKALGIKKKVTLARVDILAPDKVNPRLKKPLDDIFKKKAGRVIQANFIQDDALPFTLTIVIGWREDEAKVVGYGLYFLKL